MDEKNNTTIEKYMKTYMNTPRIYVYMYSYVENLKTNIHLQYKHFLKYKYRIFWFIHCQFPPLQLNDYSF